MKKTYLALVSAGLLLLGGCGQVLDGDGMTAKDPDAYDWEKAGVTVLLPEGTLEHCTPRLTEDGDVSFCLKDGEDFVFQLAALPKEQAEEGLGLYTMGETDGFVLQVRTPTCGTLNAESNREIWQEFQEKASEIVVADISAKE